jgi:hypothetical protein
MRAREGDRCIPDQVRNDKKRVGAQSKEEIAAEEKRYLAMTRLKEGNKGIPAASFFSPNRRKRVRGFQMRSRMTPP